MKCLAILISGAGIAGPILAWWLLERAFAPVLVERAPQFRTGGYMIDFWGVGWEVAERMGLIPRLRAVGYKMERIVFVDAQDRVRSELGNIFARAVGDHLISLPRGHLARAIYDLLKGKVEMIYDDSITSLDEQADGVEVTFEHAAPRKFDLVAGCDGLHSVVREKVFGPEAQFENLSATKRPPSSPTTIRGATSRLTSALAHPRCRSVVMRCAANRRLSSSSSRLISRAGKNICDRFCVKLSPRMTGWKFPKSSERSIVATTSILIPWVRSGFRHGRAGAACCLATRPIVHRCSRAKARLSRWPVLTSLLSNPRMQRRFPPRLCSLREKVSAVHRAQTAFRRAIRAQLRATHPLRITCARSGAESRVSLPAGGKFPHAPIRLG